MSRLSISLDDYTDLPPGKIANVVTYLEISAPPAGPVAPAPGEMAVRHIARPDPQWYRDRFREIGEAWLWSSVTLMADDALARRLADPAVEVHALQAGGETIGLVDLDRRRAGAVEIAIFGVVPKAVGTGAARYLMDAALRHAFRPDVSRVWLHTCTFDHPAAIRFYLKAGFRAYKYAIEVMDDPRLSGFLPATAAPHVPVIRPDD